MLLFISSLFSVWNPLGSNPEDIKARGIRPVSQEQDALRRVDLQSSLVKAGIQLLWNLWFGASAKAGQKCFDWRMLICEDQSITQGQFGFNQRLMTKWRGFESRYQSLSAYLPSTSAACLVSRWGSESSELLPNSLLLCGTAEKLPGCCPAPGCCAAFLLHWCGTGILAFQFAVLQQLAAQLCPVQQGAGQSELQCWTGLLQTVPKYLVFIQTSSKTTSEILKPFQVQSIICSPYFVTFSCNCCGLFSGSKQQRGMHIQLLLSNNRYLEFPYLAATVSRTTPKYRTYSPSKCISRKKLI